MVFFTCNACGTSLKKNKVEGHFPQCRSCTALSCMDCNKDFWGEEYKSHVKCVSEQERYGGKVTVNKGEKKQEQWIEQIQQAVSRGGLSPKISSIIQRLLSFDNIPRKQSKFKNFLRTSVNVRDEGLAEEIWKTLETCTKQENGNEAANETKPSEGEQKEGQAAEEQSKQLSKRERKEERRKAHSKKEKKDGNKQEEKVSVEEPKQNKSKKDKVEKQTEEENGDETINSTVTEDNGQVESDVENESRKKKDRKHKKMKGQNGSVDESANNDDSELQQEDATTHKEKKNKKRKHASNGDGLNESEITDEKMETDAAKEEDENRLPVNGKKQKKRKREDASSVSDTVDGSTEADETLDDTKAKKFMWDNVITRVLKKADEHELPLKKLRKKVMAEYNACSSHQGHEKTEEKLWAKFEKKIKKNSQYKLHKDRVKLVR